MLFPLLLACTPDFTDDDTGEVTDTSDTSPETTPTVVQLYINEFMASNASYVFADGEDPDSGEEYTPDWIELYNPGSVDIDLTGYTITDDFEEPEKHTLSGLTLPAGGHLLLYADGDPDYGDTHLGFKLSSEAESIGLYAPDGTALDLIEYTDQTTDMVAARIPDGGSLQITDEATPGEPNPTSVD